jgi:cephalosporin-C deacetylase
MKNHAIARRVRELEQYAPMHTAQPDLADFWQQTLHQFADKPLNAQQVKQVTPMKSIQSYQVIYEGFDDTPLHGIYVRPADQEGQPIPCIIMFHGYTITGQRWVMQCSRLIFAVRAEIQAII